MDRLTRLRSEQKMQLEFQLKRQQMQSFPRALGARPTLIRLLMESIWPQQLMPEKL